MTKLEAIALSSLLIAFLMLSYGMYGETSDYILYPLIILFIGSSIAPELEPKAFKSPHLFRICVGLTGGILAGAVMHDEPKTYLMTSIIAVTISLFAPLWFKLLEVL